MKGILPPIHCIGVRMTSEELALSEANGAQNDMAQTVFQQHPG